jgi:dolichyl-diphosphooligosaccharide--protein glycosyltransferase
MVAAREIRDLLNERPDLEPALEAVLETDNKRETWEFSDVAVDSGSFGELVSRGIVEKDDGEYRLAEPEVVRRALAGAEMPSSGNASVSRPLTDFNLRERLSSLFTITSISLLGALFFIALLRALSFPQVFRDRIVFSGNDPYYYRYWVEQLLADPDLTLSSLPPTVASGEPLYVATMWMVTDVLGGTPTVVGWVLAWYPVVSALVSGVLLYLLAIEVTEDRRVALAAVVILAVIPGHAFRTSLGFADHHAFDYPWLGLTALSLVVLVRAELQTKRSAAGVVGLGTGIAGQVLAWEVGPLFITPIGLIVTALAARAIAQKASPLYTGSSVVAGIGLGAGLTWAAHAVLGWHTTLVAATPTLLLIGSLAVFVAAEGAFRAGLQVRTALGVELLTAVIGVSVLTVVFPALWADIMNRVETKLFRTDSIAETQALFADSFGWLLLFGFVLIIALPYLIWATRRALHDERWVVPVVYAWALFGLATIQVRFVGEFGICAAFFAGLGFIHLAAWVDITPLPKPFDSTVEGNELSVPKRQQVVALILLFLLVGSLGLVQVPLKNNQVTIPNEQYETAMSINTYSEQEGLEYPQNYVYSDWGRNRVYNYFVSGESASYAYARDRFDDKDRGDTDTFVEMTDPDRAYGVVADRPGFLVLNENNNAPTGSMYDRLFNNMGSRAGDITGLGQYQLVDISRDGSYKSFRIVPGAKLTGPSEGESVRIRHKVDLGGDSFIYERVVPIHADAYQVVVPYPGEYMIGEQTETIGQATVESGNRVSRFEGPGLSYWSFNEGEGDVAFDRWGGYNAELSGGDWITGSSGPARSLRRNATATANFQTAVGPEESLTIDFTIRGNLTATGSSYPNVFYAQHQGSIGAWARQPAGDFGVRFDDADGTALRLFPVEQTQFKGWTRFTVALDREQDELRLYRNGTIIGTRDASNFGRVYINQITFGSAKSGEYGDAAVDIDEVRIYRQALLPSEVDSHD